jgi:hypothetical protein
MVRHRNADLYFVLLMATILVGVQLWNQQWTTALFAGVLASFAISLIRLRGQLPRVISDVSSVFMTGTPPDLPAEYSKAKELMLLGVSLDRTIRNSVAYLETFLRSGGQLRVLVVNPDCEAAVIMADRRAYLEHGVEQRRQHIRFTFDSLRKLVNSTGKTIDVKIIDDPLTFGAAMIDGGAQTKGTKIVIQHYSYKKHAAREPNPVFVLKPSDGLWFSEFRDEIEGMWRDAAEFDLNSAARETAAGELAGPTIPEHIGDATRGS